MATFQAHKQLDEAQNLAALNKMKRLATFLLVGMGVLALVSYKLENIFPLIGAVRAFSEAALVGALADWFAVVALFKHPLSLPIPHTAIIQRHKDRFGRNLATFVKNNFLARETLEEKLHNLDVTSWLGSLFTDHKKVQMIAAKSTEYLTSTITELDDREIKTFSANLLSSNLQEMQVFSLFGDILSLMMKEQRHQELLDKVLIMMSGFLSTNKALLRKKAGRTQDWWMPDIVDDIFFDKMFEKIKVILSDVQQDKNHELRKKYDRAISDFINNLRHSEDFIEKVNVLGREFLADPAVELYFADLWSDIKNKLVHDLQDSHSGLREHVESAILLVGQRLRENPSTREELNRWIQNALVDFAEEYVDSIISIISDTVEQWDAVKTSQTIELYVGKDLQWIRINGTIVGGLVGLLIYLLKTVVA